MQRDAIRCGVIQWKEEGDAEKQKTWRCAGWRIENPQLAVNQKFRMEMGHGHVKCSGTCNALRGPDQRWVIIKAHIGIPVQYDRDQMLLSRDVGWKIE